jgi:transcription elongation GreA/GreB family factor
MDKQDLVAQLVRQLQASARAALAARDATTAEARDGATPDEKREDARAAHQQGTLGKAQQRRAQQALAEVDAVAQWKPAAMSTIAVGAIVEIEDPDSGEGRTLFLAPVGAGITLTGPGGDGLLSVVTPASPVGKAVLGRKVGELVEIADREWQISFVS